METCRTDLEIHEPAKGEVSWSDLLAVYRNERSQVSAAELLDRLAPWLTNARKALLAAPPFADPNFLQGFDGEWVEAGLDSGQTLTLGLVLMGEDVWHGETPRYD